jgi:dUTP pyrophosphatase
MTSPMREGQICHQCFPRLDCTCPPGEAQYVDPERFEVTEAPTMDGRTARFTTRRHIPWEENVRRVGALQVAVTRPEGKLPVKVRAGDAGYDLYVSDPVVIWPDTFVDVDCGIRIQLPAGCWGRITGRSSTLRKRGLLVNEAVIDGGYIGPIYTGVWNLSRTPVHVAAGERLAQLVLHRIESVEVMTADESELYSVDGRGNDGFGSSGH